MMSTSSTPINLSVSVVMLNFSLSGVPSIILVSRSPAWSVHSGALWVLKSFGSVVGVEVIRERVGVEVIRERVGVEVIQERVGVELGVEWA